MTKMTYVTESGTLLSLVECIAATMLKRCSFLILSVFCLLSSDFRPMPYAPCSMLSALCPMLSALCPMLSAPATQYPIPITLYLLPNLHSRNKVAGGCRKTIFIAGSAAASAVRIIKGSDIPSIPQSTPYKNVQPNDWRLIT